MCSLRCCLSSNGSNKMVHNIKWRLTVIYICYGILNSNMILASQEVITKLSTGFSKVLDQCKTELSIGDYIMEDFKNYWREEYQLLNRDLGCMMMCMAMKLDLLADDDMKIHHGKTHEFAKKHGADDAIATQLVTIIKDCETLHQDIDDPCIRILELAKCFRTKIHELKWAPSMEVILEEIMTAV